MANRIPYPWKPPAGALLNTAHPSAVGLRFFWPMWENGGIVVADVAGQQNNLGIRSNTTNAYFSTSLKGNTIRQDLSSSAGGGLNPTVNFLIAENWSWDAWVLTNGKTGASDYQNMWGQGNASGLWLFQAAGTYVLDFFTTGDNKDTTDLGVGKWHHVSLTHARNPSSVNFYVDGKFSSQSGIVSPSYTINGLLQDGGSNSESFNGMCLYQRFWSRVITPQEVNDMYVNPWSMFLMPRRRNIIQQATGTVNVGDLFSFF